MTKKYIAWEETIWHIVKAVYDEGGSAELHTTLCGIAKFTKKGKYRTQLVEPASGRVCWNCSRINKHES